MTVIVQRRQIERDGIEVSVGMNTWSAQPSIEDRVELIDQQLSLSLTHRTAPHQWATHKVILHKAVLEFQRSSSECLL